VPDAPYTPACTTLYLVDIRYKPPLLHLPAIHLSPPHLMLCASTVGLTGTGGQGAQPTVCHPCPLHMHASQPCHFVPHGIAVPGLHSCKICVNRSYACHLRTHITACNSASAPVVTHCMPVAKRKAAAVATDLSQGQQRHCVLSGQHMQRVYLSIARGPGEASERTQVTCNLPQHNGMFVLHQARDSTCDQTER
jgi:hypothetical protein